MDHSRADWFDKASNSSFKATFSDIRGVFSFKINQVTKGHIQNYVGIVVGNPRLFRLAAVDYKG
jgi:hypothetical protein